MASLHRQKDESVIPHRVTHKSTCYLDHTDVQILPHCHQTHTTNTKNLTETGK